MIIFRVLNTLFIDLIDSIVSLLGVCLLPQAILTTFIEILFWVVLAPLLIWAVKDGTSHVLLEGHTSNKREFLFSLGGFVGLLHNTFIFISGDRRQIAGHPVNEIGWSYFEMQEVDGYKGSADISLEQIQLTRTMSKFKIKFTYGQQDENNFKQVQSVHKGPVNISNIYETLTNPTYEEITFDEAVPPQHSNRDPAYTNRTNPEVVPNYDKKASQKEVDAVPSVEVISKPSSPKRQKLFEDKEVKKQQNNTIQVKKSESIKPSLEIEEIRESEFKKKQVVKQPEKKHEEAPDQIVLKAPRFKFNPDDDKQGNVKAIKKEYVRAQKAEKYLYSGIPEKSEDDFVGCFGCCGRKPKAYTISNNQ